MHEAPRISAYASVGCCVTLAVRRTMMPEFLHNALDFILGLLDEIIDYAMDHQWTEMFIAIIVSVITSVLTVLLITSLL